MNPYEVVRDFEAALCDYTGAPYCVTTTSCTMALLLACAWHLRDEPTPHNLTRPTHRPGVRLPGEWTEVKQAIISIPKFTYCGVAMSIIHAGGWPSFRDDKWLSWYQLIPYPIWDSARWIEQDMWKYIKTDAAMICLSFHPTKHLGISTHGGAILHDDPEADPWLRRARFDGRTEGVSPKNDNFTQLGWHCYMTPPTAAEGLMRLSGLPKHNEPLPWGPGTESDYPDVSKMEIFK